MMSLPHHALRRAGVLPNGVWLALRGLGMTTLIVSGYLFAAVAPLVVDQLVPTGIGVWDERWWLIPASALVFGAKWHWIVYVNWRYYETSPRS